MVQVYKTTYFKIYTLKGKFYPLHSSVIKKLNSAQPALHRTPSTAHPPQPTLHSPPFTAHPSQHNKAAEISPKYQIYQFYEIYQIYQALISTFFDSSSVGFSHFFIEVSKIHIVGKDFYLFLNCILFNVSVNSLLICSWYLLCKFALTEKVRILDLIFATYLINMRLFTDWSTFRVNRVLKNLALTFLLLPPQTKSLYK